MFRPVIFRLGLRYTSRRLLQSLLFILGVALGVAVVIAVDLANNSASRAFALSSESITGRATHQISAGSSGISTDVYRDIRIDLRLRDSAPIISEFVRVLELGDQPMRLLGVDPFAEPPFRTYLQTIDVIGEGAGGEFDALTNFISEPNTVLISRSMADRFDVEPGDTITLRPGTVQVEVRVIGVLVPNDRVSQQALDDLIMTDIATAQEIAGLSGRISRIDLILPEDYDLNSIQAILPTGAQLIDVGQAGGALAQMTEAFEINLQALSLLAVVVGVFLIYNTVNFSVVQRRPIIGILRSLGATKRQVFAFILGEAFVLGLIGTVLGMGLGIIFGRFAVVLVSQTISDLYFNVTVNTVTVDPFTLIKGASLGILASVGAAVVPSVSATRTAPAGSMRRSSFEEQTRKLVPYITVAGAVCFIIGIGLLQVPTDSLFISFGALFFVIFGGALFTPIGLLIGVRIAVPLINPVAGVIGRMSARAITRSLSRTSVAVAALTIAVSVIVGVSVMIGSFRSTVGNWLDNTLGADIYISPPLLTANQPTTDVDPILRDIVAGVDGIDRVSASRSVTAIAPDYPDMLPVNVIVTDFDIGDARSYAWRLNDGDMQAELDNGAIMVSEPFAFRRGITPDNNEITLITDQGEQTFEITAIYFDYTTDQGAIHMSRQVYDQFWNDPFISSLAAYVTDVSQLDAVIDTLQVDTLAGFDLQIQSNRSLREGVFEVFERTFTITVALRLLATLVAFIGILSALMSLQLESTPQYGVMRATGMVPRQLWQFTFWQTGIMGTIAGILAVPIGIVLAAVLVFVINVRSFGWSMQFTLPPNELITAFFVAVVAAMLAGLYPAYKLSTMNTSRALRSE